MSWMVPHADGVVLTLRIVPRAARNEISGEMGNALKIRLQAPPVEGKANRALIAFLADALDVPRRAIASVSGETGRNKRVVVTGMTEAAVRRALGINP
jgi:uncharacterized protein (TIGR00251 family)